MSNHFGKRLFTLLCVSTLGVVSGATYHSVSADNQTTEVTTTSQTEASKDSVVEEIQPTDSTEANKEVTAPTDDQAADAKDDSATTEGNQTNKVPVTESEKQDPVVEQPKPEITQPEKEVSKPVEKGQQTHQSVPVAEPNQEKVAKPQPVAQKEKKTGIALGSPRNFLNKGQKVDKWVRITDDDNVYVFNNDEWNTTDYTSTLKSTTMALNLVGKSYHVIEEYTSTFGILYYRIEVDGVEYVISSGVTEPVKKYPYPIYQYFASGEYLKGLDEKDEAGEITWEEKEALYDKFLEEVNSNFKSEMPEMEQGLIKSNWLMPEGYKIIGIAANASTNYGIAGFYHEYTGEASEEAIIDFLEKFLESKDMDRRTIDWIDVVFDLEKI